MGHVQGASEPFIDDQEESPLLGGRLGRPYGEQASNGTLNGSAPNAKLIDVNQFDKSRWRSIRVMYLSMFLGAITFTITMSSLWPFLQVLDPASKSSFLGWVVASYSVGQLFASPLFGAWANYRQSSKEPLTISLSLMVLSNIFYTYLQSMPNHKDMYMILARGLIGFSAGNIAVVRSYVSGATTVQERTSAMANLSICQAMGFIMGPVLQSIMVLVKYPGPVESDGLHFNMYTAPAFFAASVALLNLILFLVIFKEYRLNDKDEEKVNANGQNSSPDNMEKSMDTICQSNSHEGKEYKLDMLAVVSSIYLFFVVLFMFTVFETIGTPLTMHMYAWSKSKATFYQGIILGAGGCLSICVFAATKMLARKYNERYLLLIGFLFCLAGYFAFIPWGHVLPPRAMAPVKNNSHPTTSSEAIFYMFNDVLYEHKHSFGDDTRKRLNESESHNVFSMPDYITNNNYIKARKGFHENDIMPTKSGAISMQVHQNPVNHSTLKRSNSSHLKTHRPISSTYFTSMNSYDYIISHNPTTAHFAETIKPTLETDTSTTTTLTPTTTTPTTTTPTTTMPSTTTPSTTTPTTTTPSTTTPTTTTPSTTTPTTSTPSTTTPTTTTPSTTTPTTTTPTTTTPSTTTRSTSIPTTTTVMASTSPTHANHTVTPEGCPWEYDWCGHVPKIPLLQYLFASFLITVGYPMCNMLTYTIYSKVLGPKPQGLWMGWLTASGSFARTVGPIYVSQIYDSFGPQVTYGSISLYIFITVLFYLFVSRRLVPFSFTTNPRAPLLFWRKRNRPLL